MNLKALAKTVSADSGVTPKIAGRVLQMAFDIVRKRLAKEKVLSLEGLGTFMHKPGETPGEAGRTLFHPWTPPDPGHEHRNFVGGLWDEVGKLQFDFVSRSGLAPTSRLLDIGCGCLRGGVWFVDYLNAGNYYGIDIDGPMLDAGYEIELKERGLQQKVPRENLRCDGVFEISYFKTKFDFALAQSLFTHLPKEQLRNCLANLTPWMNPGSKLFATFFLVPDAHPMGQPFERPPGIPTYDRRNPFHYRRRTIIECAARLPWTVSVIGEWGHPRQQQMVTFTRQ